MSIMTKDVTLISDLIRAGVPSELIKRVAAAIGTSNQSRIDSADFDSFWERYPHKVGKAAARRAFDRALREHVDFAVLMEALELYRNKRDDRPWCNPATWLNEARWQDQPNEVNPNGRSVLAAIDRQADKLRAGNTRRVDYTPRQDDLLGLPQGRLRGPGQLPDPDEHGAGEIPGSGGELRDGSTDRNPKPKQVPARARRDQRTLRRSPRHR